MKFGYFDEANKEYIITRQDTPTPWCNYLGSPKYGAIISNNASGYSFVESGAMGRILRFRFNTFAANHPGRYIYLRDKSDGDYWSASWQPVGKSQEQYKSQCRHGTGYTRITSSYGHIVSDTVYYIPLDKSYEVWHIKIKNTDHKRRELSVFSYAEFTNDSNYEQDMVNLQYTQLISRTYYKGNLIVQTINENCSEASSGHAGTCDEAGDGINRFIGAVGADVVAYDGDRDIFIGDYRNYGNPIMVEAGQCSNSLNYNNNSCGALQLDVVLEPQEEKAITFILGPGNEKTAKSIMERYHDTAAIEGELDEIKNYWHSKLNKFQVKTPDDNLNNSVNVWNAYQCFITFIWSRTASFQYCGLRNGYGYRDTVQDIQGIMHLEPEMASERLRFMLSAQVSNGGGLPLVRFKHNPGHEGTPEDEAYARETGHPFYRADDALWLFPTILRYVNETGRWDFYDEVIPYADKGEDSVFGHMKRAIQFNLERLGRHGLPVGLHADWNDCLRLGHKGESMFVAFQWYYALKVFKEVAEKKLDSANAEWANQLMEKLDANIQEHAWEGDRFVRGFTEEDYIVGSKYNEEANMWVNPQSWAVISGAAKDGQGRIAMDTVYNTLNTRYGIRIFKPSFRKMGLPVARMALMNPATKENGGIFSQTQGWAVLAEALLGNGARAYEYFSKCNPATMNDRAEVRKLEPYAHGQSVESEDSPFEGRAQIQWLTGTASTAMVGVVEGILGVQPELEGLRINPCIPAQWEGFSMYREFRCKKINIKVDNKHRVEKGVTAIVVNGETLTGDLIPFNRMKPENEVTVLMG